MTDVFNLSIPHLRQWSQRERIDHRTQNEPVEAINQLTTGIAPPRMGLVAPPGGPAGISFAMVESLSDDVDVVFIRYLDISGNPSSDPTPVMVWPRMTNVDWTTFVGTDIVIPVVQVHGLPYLMQLPRWYMRDDPGGMPGGDCSL